MKFLEFQNCMRDLPAFNLNDARKHDPGFHRQQLYDWQQRGFIQSLAGGFYVLADTQVDESLLLMLANRIYEPSYVSRESALAYYLIIPETVLKVTSVTSRKTRLMDSHWGQFSYSSVKPNLMFGYRVVKGEKLIQYKVATLEKAVLDYLYWNHSIEAADDFQSLRWNRQELSDLVDSALITQYLKVFDNRALEHRVNLLMEYIHA